jgi:hypothetical protein
MLCQESDAEEFMLLAAVAIRYDRFEHDKRRYFGLDPLAYRGTGHSLAPIDS